MLKLFKKPVSIEQVFALYNKEIFRYFYIRTKSREESEDLASEVFIKFLQTFNSAKSSDRTWLYILAKSILLNHFKKAENSTIKGKLGEQKVDEKMDTTNVELNVEMEIAIDALKSMPNKDSEILLLRLINDLSFREIAEITKSSINNVKVQFHRSLKKFKTYFIK